MTGNGKFLVCTLYDFFTRPCRFDHRAFTGGNVKMQPSASQASSGTMLPVHSRPVADDRESATGIT
jgi:hypothetical protein